MMLHTTRSLDKLVEEQLQRWQTQKQAETKKVRERPKPVITISRETGSRGSEVARRLSRKLNMDLIGAGIIQQVAESADISAKVVESLDEKNISLLDGWLTALFQKQHLWADVYLQHLTKVIGTIGQQGNAIIVGRGAHFILPPENTFRLRFIAPLETRIRNIMGDRKYSWEEAESFIYKTEAERLSYLRRYYHADAADPHHYDMIINTGFVPLDGAVEAVISALKVWEER
jgi:cytidylate kinase